MGSSSVRWADGCGRQAEIGGDLLACEALSAQGFDLCRHRWRRRPVEVGTDEWSCRPEAPSAR